MMIGRWMCAVVAGLSLAGCVTTQKDVTGSGDDRLDDTSAATEKDAVPAGRPGSESGCASGEGDLVLIDARNGNPISCASVTLSRDVEGCEATPETECATEVLLKSKTTSKGQIKLPDPALANVRLWAVSEGFQASPRDPAPIPAGKKGEIEMVPEDGFLLKFVDAEGNYLTHVSVAFKQGETVIAQMRTNELANVYFAERTPFAGEPVIIEAEGFGQLTISGPKDLGADGNTVTLTK